MAAFRRLRWRNNVNSFRKSMKRLREAGLIEGVESIHTGAARKSRTTRHRRRRTRSARPRRRIDVGPERGRVTKVTMTNDGSTSAFRKKVEHDGYLWDEELDMPAHRAQATRILGRPLDSDEHVHHCNHNKEDNAPENLFVLSPMVHDIVHISTLIVPRGRKWICGIILKNPYKLSEMLKKEGIPHVWLKEVQDAKSHGIGPG
jgi:hypothetical protein